MANTAIGYQALTNNEIGESNFVMGFQAGYNNTASENHIVGYEAGVNNTTGSSNTFIGHRAGKGNNTGFHNTFIGHDSGFSNTMGSTNTAIGYQAGDNLTTGSHNLILGYNIDVPLPAGDNQLNIGNIIYGTGIDGSGTTLSTGNIGIGTDTPTSRLMVKGTSAAMADGLIHATDNANRSVMQVGAGGNVGINATLASILVDSDILTVRNQPTNGFMNVNFETSATSGGASPTLRLKHNLGALDFSTSTPMTAGSQLGVIAFEGSNTGTLGGYGQGARISSTADTNGGTWTAASTPGSIILATTKVGELAPTDAIRINSEQTVKFTGKLNHTGLPSGATEPAGLVAGDFWVTVGHASLPDGVIIIKQ